MDAQFVAECAVAGGISSVAAAAYELLQFTRKSNRTPWRRSDDSKKVRRAYPTFTFWLCSNVILRLAVAVMFVGLQAAAEWIASIGAAIVIGGGSTFALSGAATSKDTGFVSGGMAGEEDDGSTNEVAPRNASDRIESANRELGESSQLERGDR